MPIAVLSKGLGLIIVAVGCVALALAMRPDEAPATGPAGAPSAKRVTLAIRDDWDKGEDLDGIARDFALIKELGVEQLFFNMNWDSYEPERGQYDFDWLHSFVELAAEHGLTLRPYICYTPYWAGEGWNGPPHDIEDWRRFCEALGTAMSRHSNIASYEIWMEQNFRMWWTGTVDQYREIAQAGSGALRAAHPGAEVVLGGVTYPDARWLRSYVENDGMRHVDVVAIHCYDETWRQAPLEDFFGDEYRRFLQTLDEHAPAKSLWMSEGGYSTQFRTERDQANFIARAVPLFLAHPDSDNRFTLYTHYELRDLPAGSDKIGDEHNYHFGLVQSDGVKKLAFFTYQMLVGLLGSRAVTPANHEVAIKATKDDKGALHHTLLRREDGAQILFVYDKEREVTVRAKLTSPGKTCTRWNLDGTSQAWAHFDGAAISNIALTPGEVWVFEVR